MINERDALYGIKIMQHLVKGIKVVCINKESNKMGCGSSKRPVVVETYSEVRSLLE